MKTVVQPNTTSYSHTIICEGWGTIWEMSNSVRVMGHKLSRLCSCVFFSLCLFLMFDDSWYWRAQIVEANSFMHVFFFHPVIPLRCLSQTKISWKDKPEHQIDHSRHRVGSTCQCRYRLWICSFPLYEPKSRWIAH